MMEAAKDSLREALLRELKETEKFFDKSTSCLAEEDSVFAPQDGMFTVAQQVAHVARTVEWFRDAMIRPEGFDMDFEKHWLEIKDIRSITEARKRLHAAFEGMTSAIARMGEAELRSPFPVGPVMGGAPRFHAVGATVDHTAHHRGALTVYSRMLGKVPAMPYL